MSQNGKLTPNLDEKSTKVLNLTVLQRIDPFVEEILITAAHVTLYEFNIDNNQWSRKDVEGSLFVVKRNTQPRFKFIVMNRRNTDNLVENLLEDFEYEVQVPYLLYRNASQEVNGIWFYNARECEHVANLFNRILNAYVKMPTKSKVSPCESDFAELEAVPSRAVIDGPLEPTTSTPSSVPDIADDRSFVNFFSTAMDAENAPIVAISGQPYQYPSTVRPAQTVPCMGSAPNVATVQPYQSPANIPGGHPQGVTLPTFQVAQTSASCKPVMSILENPESGVGIKHSTDLVKPSSFVGPSPSSSSPLIMPPITSSVPTAPPLNSIGNVQQPYGTPLLQPFPPPTPPPSFTPGPATDYGPMISREKIRDTLQILVQDTQFIDLVYQAVNNAHRS